MYERIWLLTLWNVFYSRTETCSQRAVGLNSCKVFLILIKFLIWFLSGFQSFPLFVCCYCPFTLLKNFILLNTHAYIFIVKFLLLSWKWTKFGRNVVFYRSFFVIKQLIVLMQITQYEKLLGIQTTLVIIIYRLLLADYYSYHQKVFSKACHIDCFKIWTNIKLWD